jgi:hypothetical protein
MTVTVLYGCPKCRYRHRISSRKPAERKVLLSPMGGEPNRENATRAHATDVPSCAQRMMLWHSTTMTAA